MDDKKITPDAADVETFGLDSFGAGLPPGGTDWAAVRDEHLAAIRGPAPLSPAERQDHLTLALIASISLLVTKLGSASTMNLVSGALAGIGGILGGGRQFGQPAVCPDCGMALTFGYAHDCPNKPGTPGGAP